MKPKNKYQQHVVELSSKLPAITDKQKQWAFEHCFETDGYFTKGSVWCLHCGEVFEKTSSELIVSLAGDEAVCPKCGRKLRLENSRKSKYKERWYYTILTAIKGFQVCRHFIVEKTMWKVTKHLHGCGEPYFTINEAVQNWIDENGKETIIARPCKAIMGVYDAWDFAKPMEIRRAHHNPYAPDKYDIDAKYIYPHRNILPKIKRNGFSGRLHGISASELFKLLLSDRKAEILIKNGQYDLLRHIYKRSFIPYFHSVRIAIRNKYIIKDASMWIDYIGLLEYFHLDTHNAHYVCPRNLKAEHDRLLARKRRIEEKIAYDRKVAEARKWEEKYKESKSKSFGICFGNKNIIITVIQSVADMAEEGKAMHHCVYTNGYYKKPDSLILSAKSNNGERIETIEIDLKTFKVIQSRGVWNKNTDQHDEIIQLVNNNINLIKRVA